MWTLYLILLIERNRQVQQILPFVSYNTSAPRIIFGFKLNTAASHIPHVSPSTYKIEVIHRKNNSRCNLGMKVKHYFNVMLVDDVQMRNRGLPCRAPYRPKPRICTKWTIMIDRFLLNNQWNKRLDALFQINASCEQAGSVNVTIMRTDFYLTLQFI